VHPSQRSGDNPPEDLTMMTWRELGMTLTGTTLAALAGCAPPCHDDGLNQGGCPADTDASETDPSETESASMTQASVDGTADGTASDPTAVTAGGDGEMCPELQEVLLPTVPTFQLVVDGSGSMNEPFDNGDTRWEAMESTLVGPDGVVTDLQSSIRFGLSLYRNPGMMCPDVTTLSPQLDASDEISTVLAANVPNGDTPTGESLVIATQTLLDDAWDGEKVLVLATDGEPDTCQIPEPNGMDEVDQVRGVAIDAVVAAFGSGIRTYVISVGTEVAQEHLQDLANAGVGNQAGDPDAEFWVANDTASLVAAFDAIVAGIRPCTFPLSMPLSADLAPSCNVTVNDDAVTYQDANGWTLADDSTLELTGTACASIQQGVVAVAMTCTCVPQ
jgi:hypothetical protein